MSSSTSFRMSPAAERPDRILLPATPHSAQVKAAFNNVVAPVSALSALIGDEPDGIIATSLSVGVSFDPPMVMFAVRNGSRTWPRLRRAPRIGISVLGQDQSQLCRQIAYNSGTDRFSRLALTATPEGAVLLEDASTWFDCSIESEVPAGDHQVVVFRVHAVDSSDSVRPLAFHRTQYSSLTTGN